MPEPTPQIIHPYKNPIYYRCLPPFIAFALKSLVPCPFCVKSGMTPFMEMPSSYPE